VVGDLWNALCKLGKRALRNNSVSGVQTTR
jgi:hypothetical protein